MSYPAAVYTGDTGEVSAWARSASTPPDLGHPSLGACHYVATGAQTGGAFGLYRWDMAAASGGPAPHFHRSITESFYVLDGEVEIFDGTGWRDCGPGDFVHVPEGGVHGFRNASDAPASMLIHFTPGAPARGLLRDASGQGAHRGHDGAGLEGLLPAARHVLDVKGTTRFLTALRALGIDTEPHHLEDSTRTAVDAAAAVGCEVGAICSSLFFIAGEEPLLVLTSGAHRVDEAVVAELVGAPLRRASADEVRAHTGYAIGGVAPIGHPTPLRTLVDVDLGQHPVVWAAAGHPHSVFPTTYDELVAISGGTPARVGE